MSIQETINQLQSYTGPDKLVLHPAANEALLTAVENTYGITLPDDFKELYRFTDGFETEEDMFNIIPLAEVISNKKDDKHSPFYIAEYLMYSDMWWLDVNPNDNNDYKICVHSNGNTLILTNSLGEFIDHFLRGGVFEPGGLYYWHNEIEALPIYSTKLYTAKLLLTVFYYGLRYNFIQPKEVIEWADRLIMHENEPEHFFLDLSLGHDKNGLINILYPIIIPESGVVARAILGLLYHRLLAGSITVNDAVTVMDIYDFGGPLTKSEKQQLYYLPNDEWTAHTINDATELDEEVLEFLTTYKEFKIANYKYWNGFSNSIEFNFKRDEENSAQKAYTSQDPKVKNKANINWVLYVIYYMLALISFVVIITTYPLVKSKTPISSFRSDLYQVSHPFFTVFVLYHLSKFGLWLIKRWSK